MKNAKGNKTVIIGQIWSEVVNTLYTRPTGKFCKTKMADLIIEDCVSVK